MKSSGYTVIGFILLCELAGGIGSIFTSKSIPTWFAALNKPFLNPPNWVFGPVWTTIFALMGIAAYLVYSSGAGKTQVRAALIVFGVQLALNIMWSLLFFGLHNPFLAFVELVVLWASILATIVLFYPISSIAALLLVPYILWVSFAGYLNYLLWMLNK